MCSGDESCCCCWRSSGALSLGWGGVGWGGVGVQCQGWGHGECEQKCHWNYALPNIKYSEHHVYFEISQYHTSGSTFSSSLSKQVAASSDYSDSRLGTQPNALLPVFVLADPTSPLASCARARPKGLGHGFCSQNLVVWNSL